MAADAETLVLITTTPFHAPSAEEASRCTERTAVLWSKEAGAAGGPFPCRFSVCRACVPLAVDATLLQVLKITKYLNMLFPPMAFFSQVLVESGPNLYYFTICFIISVVAFADCFYVLLGPQSALAPGHC